MWKLSGGNPSLSRGRTAFDFRRLPREFVTGLTDATYLQLHVIPFDVDGYLYFNIIITVAK
jgi:hypothetical protein